MDVEARIEAYLSSLPEPKQGEMRTLHELALQQGPSLEQWFVDGKNDEGKVVSNPNIGHGSRTARYADGNTKEFYRVGLSANTTGISVYILGLEDKTLLKNAFGNSLGKASVTGYCIKFKTLRDIDLDVLRAAIRLGLDTQDR